MIGFADGTADHVRWMTHGGIRAYAPSYPQVPIQVFFVILVVADPLIVVLLGLVRRESIWLACAVMVLDTVANWVGNWSRIRHDPGLNVPWLITFVRRVRARVCATAAVALASMCRSYSRGPLTQHHYAIACLQSTPRLSATVLPGEEPVSIYDWTRPCDSERRVRWPQG